MNIFVFSANSEVCKHLLGELSDAGHSTQLFTSIDDLKSALRTENTVQLIYHLGLRNGDEEDFSVIQTDFKKKLNTLVLTNSPSSEQGVRLLNINIRGYANTYLEKDKLLMAMNIIEQGEIWAGASLIHYMLSNNSIDRNESSSIDEEQSFYQLLTPREQEIAQKILTGLQNKLIADELDITERTVKAHLSTIYKKLEVRNRLELTLKLQNTNRRTPS